MIVLKLLKMISINRPFVLQSPTKKGVCLRFFPFLPFYDLNLTKIQSLPIPGKEWQYFFYVDLKFDDYAHYREAMNAVNPLVEDVKIMGEYKSCC